jgi:hypothetical protein
MPVHCPLSAIVFAGDPSEGDQIPEMLDGRPADAETLPPPLVSVAGASDDEVVGETSLVAGT